MAEHLIPWEDEDHMSKRAGRELWTGSELILMTTIRQMDFTLNNKRLSKLSADSSLI